MNSLALLQHETVLAPTCVFFLGYQGPPRETSGLVTGTKQHRQSLEGLPYFVLGAAAGATSLSRCGEERCAALFVEAHQ